MGDRTFEVNDNDRANARIGIEAQAQGAGVDMTVVANVEFVEAMIDARASQLAEGRFLQGIIHSPMFGDDT